MAFITARDGTRLYWHESGEGAPMLFLNSLGLGSRMWDYQIAAFADRGFRCIGFDRRGHGRSDQPARGYDFDTFADDVASLVEALDLSAVTLIGHSMAGGEIVRYLMRHGTRRVARIILLGPTTPILLQSADNPRGVPRAQFESLWTQWRRDYPQWVASAIAPFFVEETSPAMMQWVGQLAQQVSLPVALACSRAVAEADFRAEMRRVDVPALVVHGDRDSSAPLDLTGRPSAELLPQGKLLVYAGAAHGLLYTQMERLHDDILEFVRETGFTRSKSHGLQSG